MKRCTTVIEWLTLCRWRFSMLRKFPLRNKVQLCCTLYQWFLHVEALGRSCMPTNECSKGGELFATGQLSNSSPNHDHTHRTCLQTSILCLPLYSFVHQTKGLLFCCLIGVLGHCLQTLGPQGLSDILQHNCALFCNVS